MFDPRKLAAGFGDLTKSATPLITNLSTLVSTDSKTRLLGAVRYAHNLWRQQAKFQNITIHAVSALGAPGCLAGPALEPSIKSAPGVVGDQGAAASLRDAVARGVSKCFADWQGGVTVPGLPWYPSFAAWPGPAAPPMPNVATPLIACPSALAARLTKHALQQEIVAALPSNLRVAQVETGVAALAESLAMYFTIWLPSQMVMNVLGQGPVPSFAPPYVPVGPVVGGDIISVPGHLMGSTLPQMTTL